MRDKKRRKVSSGELDRRIEGGKSKIRGKTNSGKSESEKEELFWK